MGAIVGGVVGGLVFIAFCAGIVVFILGAIFLQRRRARYNGTKLMTDEDDN